MISNPGEEYIADLEELITILDKVSQAALMYSVRRAEYASIPPNDVVANVKINRDDRKTLLLAMAIYGNAFTSAGTFIQSQFIGGVEPTTLFALLALLVGSDELPVYIVTQTAAAIRALVYGLEHKHVEMDGIRPLFSTAFLNRQYADKE